MLMPDLCVPATPAFLEMATERAREYVARRANGAI